MDVIQIVADPRRREILRLCWDGESGAGDLAAHFDITFGAVSQHLKVLRDAGLVSVRRHGAHRYYRANRDDDYVACALVHDIGDTLGSYNHADIAAAIVKPFVSAARSANSTN